MAACYVSTYNGKSGFLTYVVYLHFMLTVYDGHLLQENAG